MYIIKSSLWAQTLDNKFRQKKKKKKINNQYSTLLTSLFSRLSLVATLETRCRKRIKEEALGDPREKKMNDNIMTLHYTFWLFEGNCQAAHPIPGRSQLQPEWQSVWKQAPSIAESPLHTDIHNPWIQAIKSRCVRPWHCSIKEGFGNT